MKNSPHLFKLNLYLIVEPVVGFYGVTGLYETTENFISMLQVEKQN